MPHVCRAMDILQNQIDPGPSSNQEPVKLCLISFSLPSDLCCNSHVAQVDSSVLQILLAPMHEASKWKAMYAKLEDVFEVDAISKKRRLSHQDAEPCRTSGHDHISCAPLNSVFEVCNSLQIFGFFWQTWNGVKEFFLFENRLMSLFPELPRKIKQKNGQKSIGQLTSWWLLRQHHGQMK